MLKSFLRFELSYFPVLFQVILVTCVQSVEGKLFNQTESVFCIQTFNIYGPAYAPFLASRTQELARTLGRSKPCELLFFQEFWRAGHRQYFYNQLQRQSPGTSLKLTSADELRNDSWSTGLALLTPLNILEQGSFLFKKNTQGFLDFIRKRMKVTKGFSWHRLQSASHPSFEKILFINTHLHPTEKEIQREQVLQLFDFIRQLPAEDPVVVVGDFNQPVGGEVWTSFLRDMGFYEAFDRVHEQMQMPDPISDLLSRKACTYCSDNPLSWNRKQSYRIDHVYYRSPEGQLNPMQAQIVFQGTSPSEPLSDHYGVQVQFKLRTFESNRNL